MMTQTLYLKTLKLVQQLTKKGMTVSAAESCTGGLICATITNVEGSSKVLKYGFVTYHPDSKAELVGVSKDDINKFGVVSEPIARQMAEGALKHGHADIAVGVTGNIGNTTNDNKGHIDNVWLACAIQNKNKITTLAKEFNFTDTPGDETGIHSRRINSKYRIVEAAIDMMLEQTEK